MSKEVPQHPKVEGSQQGSAHDQTPFHCAECDKYFGDNNTLRLHNKKHDPDATVFACDEEGCDKVFREKGRLTQHKKLHDPKLNDLPCKFACGKKFTGEEEQGGS